MPNYKLKEGSIQYGFHMSRKKMQAFGGAYGNGKTTGLVMKALRLCSDYPGSAGLLARETYPKLNGTLRKVFMLWCPPHWIKKKPTQDENTCYLMNGSYVDFRYIAQRGKQTESGETTSNLLSASYDWIGIDQIEDPGIMYKDLLDLFGRLRGQTPYRPDGDEDESMPRTGPRWMMVTANPTPGWFFKEVVQPYITWRDRGIKTEKLIVDENGLPLMDLFEGSVYTNADNLAADYIKTNEALYKGQMRDRYLLGKWAAFEGLVYPGFDPARNTITRETALDYLDTCRKNHVEIKVVEAYDFGLVSPSCYMLAFVDNYGRVFVIDGFYQGDFPYHEHAAAIRAIRAKYAGWFTATKAIRADPAIFRKQVIAGTSGIRYEAGTSLARLLQDDGLFMQPAANDMISGIAKVSTYIAGLPHTPHIVTGDAPGPLLYIVDDLTWFMDEISSYYWKRNMQGQTIDEPMGDVDHSMDTVKYMLSILPEASEIKAPQSELPPAWMYWRESNENAYEERSV